MNPYIIIVPVLFILGTICFRLWRNAALKSLSGKKVMLFGMPESGKTVLFNWLVYGKETVGYQETGQMVSEKSKKEPFTDKKCNITYSDMGGKDEFLNFNGEKYYLENDFIFFLFDSKRYFEEDKYRKATNIRLEFLSIMSKRKPKPILMIASHKDCLTKEEQDGFSSFFRNQVQEYELAKNPNLVVCNLTNKDDVAFVFKEVKKTWNEWN